MTTLNVFLWKYIRGVQFSKHASQDSSLRAYRISKRNQVQPTTILPILNFQISKILEYGLICNIQRIINFEEFQLECTSWRFHELPEAWRLKTQKFVLVYYLFWDFQVNKASMRVLVIAKSCYTWYKSTFRVPFLPYCSSRHVFINFNGVFTFCFCFPSTFTLFLDWWPIRPMFDGPS